MHALVAAIDQHTSSYRIGEYVGLGLLAILVIALGRRVVAGRSGATGVAGCLLASALLVAGIVRVASHHPADAWASQAGVDARAGYLDGCNRTGQALVDCGCVFATLTHQPAYDSPSEFLALGRTVEKALRDGDASAVPAAYVGALRSCRR